MFARAKQKFKSQHYVDAFYGFMPIVRDAASPHRTEAAYHLARIYHVYYKNYELAIHYYQGALSLAPSKLLKTYTFYYMAQIYGNHWGYINEAMWFYQSSIKLATDVRALQAQVGRARTNLKGRVKRYKESRRRFIGFFDEGECDPSHFLRFEEEHKALFQSSDREAFDAMFAEMRDYVHMHQYVEELYKAGKMCVKRKEAARGYRYLQKALKYASTYEYKAKAHFYMGLAYFGKRRYEDAQEEIWLALPYKHKQNKYIKSLAILLAAERLRRNAIREQRFTQIIERFSKIVDDSTITTVALQSVARDYYNAKDYCVAGFLYDVSVSYIDAAGEDVPRALEERIAECRVLAKQVKIAEMMRKSGAELLFQDVVVTGATCDCAASDGAQAGPS